METRRPRATPSWLPLIDDPPYPDYTSGANSVTGGFMRTLGQFFGDDAFSFDVTSAVAAVVQKTRTYERFSESPRTSSKRESCWGSTSVSPTPWRVGRANRRPTGLSVTSCGRLIEIMVEPTAARAIVSGRVSIR